MGALDDVLGTLLIASWGISALSAVELKWALRYYCHFSRQDRLYFKILVALTLILGLLSLIAGHTIVYLYCVAHWGDIEYLKGQYWPVPLFFVSASSTAAIVQGFLVMRYIRFSNNWYIGSTLMIFVLVTFGSGLAAGICMIKWSDFDQRPLLQTPVRVWLIMDVVSNVSISSALIYEFHGKRTGLRSTDILIRRLIVLSIQSATIPAFCAIASWIAFELKPKTDISPMFGLFLPQTYILSLLYTLNVRENILEGSGAGTPRTPSGSNFTIGGIRVVRTDTCVQKNGHSFSESNPSTAQISSK